MWRGSILCHDREGKGTRDAQSESRVCQGTFHLRSGGCRRIRCTVRFRHLLVDTGVRYVIIFRKLAWHWSVSAFTHMCLRSILTNPLALNVPLHIQICVLHMTRRSCYVLLYWEPRGTMAKHSWQSVARLSQRSRQIHGVNRSIAHHMAIASSVKRQWHVNTFSSWGNWETSIGAICFCSHAQYSIVLYSILSPPPLHML
jgi:hypothetical protein